MEHIFENLEVGVQHTGDLAKIGEFLSGTHFEYNANDEFVLPAPSGNLVLKRGEWLIRRKDGTYYVKGDPINDALEVVAEIINPSPKKKGRKKKTK